MTRRALKELVDTTWSPNLAYAVGLLVTDGNLSKDGRHVSLYTADKELAENFKKALNIGNKINTYIDKRPNRLLMYNIRPASVLFYNFLLTIGLTPAKSKILKSIAIPKDYFSEFLRGFFDGDGSFYTFWDTRWPKAFGYKIGLASASPVLMQWLKGELSELYGVKGFIKKGKGVLVLTYTKTDTRKLFDVMYHKSDILFLARKYNKMKTAFKYDESLKILRKKKAAVA